MHLFYVLFGSIAHGLRNFEWVIGHHFPSPVLRSPMLLSSNVVIELIDHEFLFVNNAFYKIPD